MIDRQSVAQSNPPVTLGSVLQRVCACGKHTTDQHGECTECRQKRLGLQRRAVGNGPGVAPPIVHEVLRSPGRPLDDATRGFMESRFNHDFSGVRAMTTSLSAGLVVGALNDPREGEGVGFQPGACSHRRDGGRVRPRRGCPGLHCGRARRLWRRAICAGHERRARLAGPRIGTRLGTKVERRPNRRACPPRGLFSAPATHRPSPPASSVRPI